MQSVIQILRRAGSVSLSRARHTSGNRGEEPDGKDERRNFVGHFGGRKLSSSGVPSRVTRTLVS